MIYLASAYTAPTAEGRKANYQKALRFVAKLLARGEFVWSPIVHCHEPALLETMPTDFKFWLNYNHDFIRRADAVYVACFEGWEQSKGVAEEIVFASTIGIPVHYIHESDL